MLKIYQNSVYKRRNSCNNSYSNYNQQTLASQIAKRIYWTTYPSRSYCGKRGGVARRDRR
jgi:hypothetical protein